MTSNWKKYSIGELCRSVSETYKGNDSFVILVNTSDVLEGKILNHQEVHNSNLKGQFKKTFKKNDILYSEIRPANRRYAFVDIDDTHAYIASTKLMVLRANTTLVVPKFLYYLLTNNELILELQRLAETRSGTFPQITFTTELSPIEILIPPINIQNKIVTLLSSLDKMIDTLATENNILEEQLAAIFKESFGNKIVEASTPLERIINVVDNRGKTPPLVDNKSDYPIIDVGALKGDGRIIDYDQCTKYVDEATYNNFFRSGHQRPNDILISTVGTLAELKIVTRDIGCIAQNVVALRATHVSFYYLYQYLKYIKQDLVSYNIGSVQPSIKVTHIIKHLIYVPEKEAMDSFHLIAKCITSKIENNFYQSKKAKLIKDNLLPELIRGTIDLSNIDGGF